MFEHINPAQLKELIEKDSVTVVDIRDLNSFQMGHITNATMLTNDNVADFLANTSQDENVVVCCYHGNSSQGAAQYLAEQGLKNVFSLDGGFEMWKLSFPELVQG